MIHSIRTSKFSKIIASYLAIQLILTTVQPSNLFALTSGPSQPEFNAFTPIGTSDMVNLSTGDFNYNIPIMDVGGYPLNLAYDSGVTMDQEASWVGLGWNLNVGQINRQVRGIPDDFKGDEMTYENNLKPNVTVGISAQVSGQIFGLETEDYVKEYKGGLNLGMGIQYNNYSGISFKPSYGLSYNLSDNITVGMNVQTSATEGATISPNISAKSKSREMWDSSVRGVLNAGISFNSNRGLSNFGLNYSSVKSFELYDSETKKTEKWNSNSRTASGSISFAAPTFSPRKRTAFQDFNSTFSFSTGADIFGADGEIEISATASVQKIKDKTKKEKAYGYEFTGQATKHDILDYNRENDRVISKNILSLPYMNYTYDLYSVNGQGASGMFRPHRSQIGQIYDEYVKDESLGLSLGVELEGGPSFHVGANFVGAPSKSYTGVWDTKASNTFKNDNENINSGNNLDYEPVYFKYVGENKVDDERELYTNQLHGDNAMALKIGGIGFDKYADTRFRVKNYDLNTNIPKETLKSFSGKFKRTKRDVRNQSIQKITVSELKNFYDKAYAQQRINTHAKEHHTAEIRVLKPDGSTYVFGETAYNIEKQEVTFATEATGDCATGIVNYTSGENSISNKAGIDRFYDKVITPAYAHTYLISSVLSSDYEDITGNGPTDDDLGAYTLFTYKNQEDPFQWRIPFGQNEASYNEGLRSNKADQKGSYIYGQKEIKYIDKIETKTHVAVFMLSDREDAIGVNNHNGGAGTGRLQKIDEIRLYSKPEYKVFEERLENDDPSDDPDINELSPIKTAYFEYDYSLCGNLPNNTGNEVLVNDEDININKGKLTLKKVFFTYRTSLMGKHTPYTFAYDTDLDENPLAINNNPDYSLKAFDIWGNYKPNNGENNCGTQGDLTTSEFPFVNQQDKTTQNEYATAWSLTTIGLPSGGSINLAYESDDYQYVQDKTTMQMFKVVGAGTENDPSNPEASQKLYGLGVGEAKYLYVELPDEDINDDTFTTEVFKETYLKDIQDKPIYFRFLMNMTRKGALNTSSRDYDYVTGYFELDSGIIDNPNILLIKKNNNKVYGAIPMQFTPMEGGINGNKDKNPITKAGLYFARTYLNGIAFGLNQDYRTENVSTIAKKLVSSIGAVGQIFLGPNQALRNRLCAQRFIPEKSWIRLSTPKTYKLGGGSRIKQLVMNDHWNDMAPGNTNQTYGQTYEYTLENNTTSGVATFEPNDSAENPFVEPFYDTGERLVAPREVSYVEKPFGKAFFPSSKVTYSRVTVKNLDRENITRHATGKVVSEFYTTKDFPTKVDYTNLENSYKSNENAVLANLIKSLFGLPVKVKNQFELSQGYAIHTNDMNGKIKAQKVYQEGVDTHISSVNYYYSTEQNELNNVLPVIAKDGIASNKEIGVDYDVITDFREAYSKSETAGISTNLVVLPFLIPITIPTSFFSYTKHENVAHSVITTKVVHSTAILKEKTATDLGSKVSTINKAWDAETGQVILTKTVNEYDDAYYNFNFPAYWAYSNMGQATKNLGLRGTMIYSGEYFSLNDADKYLTLGDEIMASYGPVNKRLWVVEFSQNGDGVLLMDRNGSVVNKSESLIIQEDINFKIIRSGYRNQQMGNMASITLMENPLKVDPNNNGAYLPIDHNAFTLDNTISLEDNPHIINASAIAYTDFWNCQCENKLPFIPNTSVNTDELTDLAIEDYFFNPYVYNVNGEWRAEKSYAYLTERTNVKQGATDKAHTRKEGYFKQFTPYYVLNSNNKWEVNTGATSDWTFASQVTQYSPFGAELENKDALNRYSSAQYGYNFTLPTAVASNSKYRNMASDNFEDYSFINTSEGHFNFRDNVVDDGANGIEISTDQSHTGYSSLLVPSEDMATKEVELLGIAKDDDFDGDGIENTNDNCLYTFNPNQEDYDNDGIGDTCDDEAYPDIFDLENSPRLTNDCGKQKVFTLNSTPNSTGYLKFTLIERPRHKRRSSKDPWYTIHFNQQKVGGKSDYNELINGKLYEITYDATGRFYGQFQLRTKRRRGLRNRDFIVNIEVLDQYQDVIKNEIIKTKSYASDGCHGESYNTFKLFDEMEGN